MDEGKRIAPAGPPLPESRQGAIQGSFTNRSYQKRRRLGQMDRTRGRATPSPPIHPQRIGDLPNITSSTQPSFSALTIAAATAYTMLVLAYALASAWVRSCV